MWAIDHRRSLLSSHKKAIDYLTAAIKHQIDAGDSHRKAKRFAIDAQDKVSTPEGFSWSYKRQRLVKKSFFYSPKSQAKKMKTSYHRAAGSSDVPDNRNTDNPASDEHGCEASPDDRPGSPVNADESEASSDLVEQADME